MLLYLEDTEASQFKGQVTMMPFWASYYLTFMLRGMLAGKILVTNLYSHTRMALLLQTSLTTHEIAPVLLFYCELQQNWKFLSLVLVNTQDLLIEVEGDIGSTSRN